MSDKHDRDHKSEPTQCRPQKESGDRIFMEAMFGSMLGLPVPKGSTHGSEAIYASEARGQQEMVRSESLPVRTNGCSDADLEAMGIQLGQPFEEDPIFRPAILPDGWVRKGTDHNMWSEVVDGLGRKRLSIFYKAAFYDRDAHVGAEKRFYSTTGVMLRTRHPDYDRDNDPHGYGDAPGDRDGVVIDFGTDDGVPVELFRVEVKAPPDTPPTRDDTPERRLAWDNYWRDESYARKATDAWLDENYPDWRSPAAYWDEE